MAKFSKGHYEALAQTLKDAGETLLSTAITRQEQAHIKIVMELITSKLVNLFIRDNRRFDPVRFRKASGRQVCGPNCNICTYMREHDQ
jgi:hypothetical protein